MSMSRRRRISCINCITVSPAAVYTVCQSGVIPLDYPTPLGYPLGNGGSRGQRTSLQNTSRGRSR